jgi:N-methylhydantoinase B
VVKKNGQIIKLKCKETIEIEEGDIVYINTPGGGGYGNPCQRSRKAILKDIEEGRISLEKAREKYCYVGE